ncbi:phage tail protein [Klebsiella pneumoniae]|uniref:phage tail protein n=1 Tax=Klebsiella pneumoniae TaxID=573 RepID=UPI003F6E18BC
MGADKTNNIMTLSSGVSQSLLADVQYFELYSSLALNRKLKNIVLPGFYCGFEPVPGTGLSVRITSENSEGKGAASVDVNNVQISVQQIEDVTVSVKAGATNIIVLEANFEHGVKTTQVDSASSVSAARIYARTDNTIGQNQIELCRVIVPSGATAVTKEMIVLKYRVNRAVGVEFSNEISSTEERKAATPKAVKAAYDLANGKYTAQDATTTQKGIVQLSSDTNSTSETLAATPKAVKAAYDLAAGKAPSNHIHPWNQITGVPTASLTAKGITQLSSATNSTSEVLAATPKAVKAAYDLANGKYTAQDATTTQKGIVQLSSDTNSTSETLAATPKAVKAAYDLAAGKAPSNHIHPWNQITGVPTASLTAKGITQLSSATNSTSETLAATPKAVKAAYDLAAGKAPASHTHPWSQITGVPAASLTAKGTVQLSSATNSTSETLAATPKAVKAAYDLAAGKAPASHTHPWSQITGVPAASLTAKGTVQLSSATNSTSETLAATPKAVKAAYDLAAGKAPASHTHPWSQITGVPAASLTAKGTVQLSSAINSTSEILAATPKAVKAAYDLANGKQPADATLTALAGLATAADRLPYFTGADRAALATLTAIGRAIIAKGSIKDVLNYLGLGEGSALPVGVPVPWPTATPPAGWLKCDGRAFTKEQYPVLARAYPTLRLPDLRGEFIRGWDDGRKVDTGRKLLSAQGATLLRTAMLDYYNQDTTGTSGIVGMGFNNEDSITDLREGSFKMPDGTTFSDPVVVMSDNGMQATILTSIRSGYAKGITVRPRSIALNYIVRAV